MAEPLYRSLFYRHPNSTPLGRKKGIVETLHRISVSTPNRPVIFSFSESPKTDGKTVWLGALDPEDDAFEALALGHGIHEMMHIKATDMEALSAVPDLTPFLHALINILEDIRIDSLGMKTSSSYAVWREAMAEALEERQLLAAQNPQRRPPLQQVCLWMHMALTVELPMQWAARQLPALEALMAEHLPQSLQDEILTMARGARTAPDTRAVITIAQSIEKRLQEALAAPTPRGRRTELSSEAGEGGQPRQGSLRPDKPFLRRTLSAKTEAPDLGLANFLNEGSGDGKAADSAGKRAPRREPKAKLDYTVNPWPDPEAIEDRVAREDVSLYTRRFNQSEDKCRAIQRAFSQAFRCKDDDDLDEPSASGFLTAPDIAMRLRMRDRRLFVTASVHETVRGQLVVLLDRSGSMGVTRMTSAKIAVAALWQALERQSGIRRQIAVFPGLDQAHVGPLLHEGDTPRRFMTRFKAVNAFGSTPINEALHWAADTLAENSSFPGETRLILVITDGDFPATLGPALEKKLKDAQAEIAVLSIAARITNRSVASVTVTDDLRIPEALVALVGKTAFCRRLRSA